MKRIPAIALFAIANFAMAGTSFAQSSGVRANVPFDFTVGNTLLPAGTYTIKEEADHLILIKNHDKPIAALSLVNGQSNKSSGNGKLLFHKYGSQYFLSEIHCDWAEMDFALPSSKTEKKTALQEAAISQPSQTYVAVLRK